MRRARAAGFPVAVLALCAEAACVSASGYPARSVSEKQELERVRTYFQKETLDRYDKAVEPERTRLRDEIVNGRLLAMDLQFSIFQRQVTQNVAATNVAADWAVLALGGAGTIVTGGQTKTVLAALTAFVTGARASIDKHVFYEKTIPVLLSKMVAQRRAVLVTIRTGLRENADDYPLNRALVDLEDYYNAGTIPGALSDIAAGAGATLEQAEKSLRGLP